MRLRWPCRVFYKAHRDSREERTNKRPLRHCDLYVVRLLPQGRQLQGSAARDPARFGFSQPCVRCLRALAAFGVHRVIFSTGEERDDTDEIAYEIREVRQLLEMATASGGHHSRGEKGAVASGAIRSQPVMCVECS